MENIYALVGRLSIMSAYEQSEIVRGYLDTAIDLLKGSVDYTMGRLEETIAALDAMLCRCRSYEAETLRDTVEYLEGLKGDADNE